MGRKLLNNIDEESPLKLQNMAASTEPKQYTLNLKPTEPVAKSMKISEDHILKHQGKD